MIETKDKSQRGRRWAMALTAAVVLPVVLVTALAQGGETVLESFEGTDPVYTTTVAVGTAQEDLGLPESLRAVAALSDEELNDEELNLEDGTFVQAQPDVQEAQGYGYVAPEDADALYENGELVVYETEEQEYRVYGSADDTENLWFASDAAGNITGVVLDVPVTWSGSYDPDTPGEYVLTASLSGYTYAQAHPTAVITVEGGGTSLLSDNSGSAEDIAYVSNISIVSIEDGTAQFDTDTDSTSDYYRYADGNDENASNGIVRTFDTVIYDLSYTVARSDEDSFSVGDTVTICFEFILPMSARVAEWDTSLMTWASSVTTSTKTVTYDFDGDGQDETETCQVITGYRITTVDAESQSLAESLPGAAVQVLAASKGDVITPVFTLWFAGNQTSDGTLLSDLADANSGTTVTENDSQCSEHGNVEQQTVAANGTYTEGATVYEVSVTCAPRYNIQIKQGGESYTALGTYDFNTGNTSGDYIAIDLGYGEVTGKVTSYGVTIQLYNHSGCGLKGIEIPTGDITFDIELSTVFVDSNNQVWSGSDVAGYQPLVLSWGPQDETIYDGRILTDVALTYAVFAAPQNSGMRSLSSIGSTSVYNGGTWNAKRSSSGSNAISVTVSGYDILYPLFPNTDMGNSSVANTYYALSDALSDPAGTIQIGSFSAGKFFILTPYYDTTKASESEATYITNELNVSDGYLETTLTITNVEIDVDGDPTTDPVGETTDASVAGGVSDDNSITSTIRLPDTYTPTGTWNVMWSYSGRVYTPYYDVLERGNWVSGSWADNGQDALALGSAVGLIGYVSNGENSYAARNRLYAADLLVKFDSDAITLTGDYMTNGITDYGYEVTILYATKKDGTKWSNDEEMNTTDIEDLVYYASLDAVPSDAVVVAYLAEIRPEDNDPSNITKNSEGARFLVSMGATVNTDEELVGNVYQTVIAGKIWRVSEWNDAADDRGVASSGVAVIPSMLGNNPDNPTVLPAASADYCPTDYTKTKYDTDGTVTDSTEKTKGDSLLILPATVSIDNSLAQYETTGTDVYQLDNDQRYVDYVLTPSLEAYNTLWDEGTGTITITVTLPEGLSYVPNSAYQGGTYEASGQGQQGTVTGGISIGEPQLGVDEDDNVTLTWALTGVTTSSDMSDYAIYYTAEIDSGVANNTTLTTEATITYSWYYGAISLSDYRAYYESLGNLSSVDITVSQVATTSVSKTVAQRVYDPGDTITFNLTVTNSGTSDITDALILDILPHNGDSAGSSFTGSLTVSSVTTPEGWTCYYTTSTRVWGTVASDLNAEDIRNGVTGGNTIGGGLVTLPRVEWQPVTGFSDDLADATAFVWIGGTIEANGGAFRATVTLQTTEDMSAGDVIINSMSYAAGSTSMQASVQTSARAYIASRSISGLVWLDANANGIQDDGDDSTLTTVKVELLRDDGTGSYEVVQDVSGREVFVATSFEARTNTYTITDNGQTYTVAAIAHADGSYEFSGLPAGTYAVRFGAVNETPLSFGKFLASPQNAALDDYTDSDGVPYYSSDGELIYTQIDGIELPTAENLPAAYYISSNNDSGLYYKPGSITIQKNDDNGIGLKDVVFKLEVFDEDTQEWTEVTADTNTTDENGQLVYDDLTPAQYRLTEVATVKGYTLLADSIEITIPYASATAEGTPSYIEGGKTYFLDLTYTIENGQTLVMPNAGPLDSDWRLYLTLGGGVACLAALGFALSSLRRKRRIGLLWKSLLE